MQLEADDFPEMDVVEVDSELAISIVTSIIIGIRL